MHYMTEKDRYFIEKALKQKMSVTQIAKALGYTRQTIYNEIKKGKVEQRDAQTWEKKNVYLADAGQRIHEENQKKKGRPKKLQQDDPIWESFRYWILDMKYSPEAFVYKTSCKEVCVKTLYNYVHRGDIEGITLINLPYAKPKKHKKHKQAKRKYNHGVSIEDRPEYINGRSEEGHWEIDTVYSSHADKTCLMTLTERLTRKEIIVKVRDRTSKSIVKALDQMERKLGAPKFRDTFKSITCDNGVEFSNWIAMEQSCMNKGKRTQTYFAHPYSSYERGSNENENRMIRRWIPKGDDIGLYSKQEIQRIEDWINDYPRKIFGGLSAREYQECEAVKNIS